MNAISRGAFLKRAALGAAALAGISKSSDYFPPPTPENPDIVPMPGRIMVYPTGIPETDIVNLQSAISDYSQYLIELMGRSRGGARTAFTLPEEGFVLITRDVDIVGRNAVISGGDVAFRCDGGFSFGLSNVILRGQSRAGVIGYFNNVDLVSAGSEPIPVPEPASYGFILRMSGALTMINSSVSNARVGLFVEGMTSGQITSSTIFSSACGAFLNGSFARMNGCGIFSSSGEGCMASVIVGGQSNALAGNRYLGGQYANILIAQNASGTSVNIGKGSVMAGSEPIPIPEPKIIDMGQNSSLNGKFQGVPAPSNVEELREELYGELSRLFHSEGEGGGDIG